MTIMDYKTACREINNKRTQREIDDEIRRAKKSDRIAQVTQQSRRWKLRLKSNSLKKGDPVKTQQDINAIKTFEAERSADLVSDPAVLQLTDNFILMLQKVGVNSLKLTEWNFDSKLGCFLLLL